MLTIRPVKGIYAKTGESFQLTMEYEPDHIAADVKWSLSGSTLPAGLVMDEKTGSISGVFERECLKSTAVCLHIGRETAYETVSFLIDPSPYEKLQILTEKLTPAVWTEPYSFQISFVGGAPPVKVTAEGLPADLVCEEKGMISGSVEVGGGMCPVTVYVRDSTGAEVRRDFFLTVFNERGR